MGIDFDGFRADECLLQEAKGNYDQFLDGSIPGSEDFFKGFDSMEAQAFDQSIEVKANPPARLIWYFQTPLTQKKMAPILAGMGTRSVYQP